MAFNGTGTFVREYNWKEDALSGINIEADRMDGEDDGFATGLSTCITKDGQTTITANIPFNDKKITGLADATLSADAANLKVIQNRVGLYLASTGDDTIVLNLSPAISGYVAGQIFTFKAGGTNTGAATLNVNSKGAKDIKNPDGTALVAGAITADRFYNVFYDGTNFVLMPIYDDISKFTQKTTLVDGDLFPLADSEASGVKKYGLLSALKTYIGGVSTFLGLSDTPSSYSGQAGKVARVNGAENALEFTTVYTDPLTTRGDILYRGASSTTRLPKGTAGYVLTMGADEPEWAAPSIPVYTGTDADNLTFPIGSYIVTGVGADAGARNSTSTVYLSQSYNYRYSLTAWGTALTGSWRMSGVLGSKEQSLNRRVT